MSEKGPMDSLAKLIAIEWEIIHELQVQLNKETSTAEMVKISNTLAYHVNTLNRLLAKREQPTDEESLAAVIVGVHRRISRAVVGRIGRWIRRRSSRR